MEGPSLLLASEQMQDFKGQKVFRVAGNTKLDKERLLNKEVMDIFSWGKHLVFQFDTVALRVHFLLFGTYEATVNGVSVTGDYKRSRETRLTLEFANGEMKMFNCSLKFYETSDLKSTYNFKIDIMSPQWDSQYALAQLQEHKDEEIADVLLDQEVFSGVGNIIKNEVLSMAYLNPRTPISHIEKSKLSKLITLTHDFSHQFYEWRKQFVLRKNLKAHRKGHCPHCDGKITREKTGKRQRWSYYCPVCQPLK
jgi:endonuclease-8